MTGRFAGKPRRVPAAAYAACLAALLVSACNTSDTPDANPPSPQPSSTTSTAIPSPSPSETTSETPEERDARLAGEAVVKYWAVVDDIAAHPDKSLNLLDPVARDQARAQMQTVLGTYAAKGLVQKGTSSVTDVVGTTKDGQIFTVTACVDVSAVDLADQKGTSQVNPDRPDQQRYTYKVVKAAEGFFVHALRTGDIPTARAAVETALRAAPAEEVARLDLAAVGHADGRREEMQRFLRAEVFNRTDDDGPPPDLPSRTQHIADQHGWGNSDKAVG